MPRSPEDNQQLKGARRTDILRAASRVFAKKGFVATKISDIAREAGLSHGLVYHYFENKDAVFGAILEEKLARMRSAMEEDAALPGTSLDRMRASIERWLARTQEEPEMGLMIAQALLSDSLCSEVRTMMSTHAKATYAESVRRIREGQDRGEIGGHAPAEELATSLTCLMRGLSLVTLVGHGVQMQAPSVETVMRILLPTSALAAVEPRRLPAVAASGRISLPGVAARAARAPLPTKTNTKKKTARKAMR
jgi:AcrR family transcriptional regulator